MLKRILLTARKIGLFKYLITGGHRNEDLEKRTLLSIDMASRTSRFSAALTAVSSTLTRYKKSFTRTTCLFAYLPTSMQHGIHVTTPNRITYKEPLKEPLTET